MKKLFGMTACAAKLESSRLDAATFELWRLAGEPLRKTRASTIDRSDVTLAIRALAGAGSCSRRDVAGADLQSGGVITKPASPNLAAPFRPTLVL